MEKLVIEHRNLTSTYTFIIDDDSELCTIKIGDECLIYLVFTVITFLHSFIVILILIVIKIFCGFLLLTFLFIFVFKWYWMTQLASKI